MCTSQNQAKIYPFPMKPSHMLVLTEIKHVFQICAVGGEPVSMAGWSSAPRPALGRGIAVVVISIVSLLSCQHYMVRRDEHCFKNFNEQRMSLLSLLLHYGCVVPLFRYDCLVSLLCYYITCTSSITSRF